MGRTGVETHPSTADVGFPSYSSSEATREGAAVG
jgi:hypothetical protein